MASIAGGASAGTTVVDGGATGTVSGATNPFADLLQKNDEGSGPKAYLNYLFFDRNFVYKSGGYVRVSEAAEEDGTDVAHEELTEELAVTEAGYVYVYLSNESETTVEVYYDDFPVTLTEGPVVQINEYYPFGLTAYTWTREDEAFTNYLFQNKEYDSLTQWHDFHARQYDAALGRWLASDPAGQFRECLICQPLNGLTVAQFGPHLSQFQKNCFGALNAQVVIVIRTHKLILPHPERQHPLRYAPKR